MDRRLITDRCDTITKYFKEIKEMDVLSIDEEVRLTNKIQSGDKKALNELVVANLKFVVKIAKEYQGMGLSLPDLISEGNYGLMKAAVKFDNTRGFRFITYAVYWIKQSVMQSLNDNSRTIRLPTNIILKMSQMNKELKTYDDVLENQFGDTKQYPSCVSLSEPMKGSGNDRGIELSETIEDTSVTEEEQYGLMDIEVDRLKRVIKKTLGTLDDRERCIVEHYYGLNPDFAPMTLEDIGDVYNLTKERIRQIKEKAIRRLRHNNEELYSLINE